MAQLHKNNVRLRIVGDRSQFETPLLKQIQAAEQLTAHNTGLTLVIAVNYTGRWDLVQATQKLLLTRDFDITSPKETEQRLQSHLSLSDLPDPDLLIRTSGEQRISNFMLWQLAWTEMVFPEAYWPDFTEQDLEKALLFYQTRERRFGLTSAQVEAQYA